MAARLPLAPAAGELIRVVQLPVIVEQLRGLKDEIGRRTGEAMTLVCDEDNLQAVKTMRADLNKQFDALETVRKAVKTQIMTPYEQFEAVYQECVTEPFKRADADLKGKITDTENEIKRICEENLYAYFDELRRSRDLDWLAFERSGVKVDMASAKAKTPKKLMERLKLFVDGVAQSVKMIDGMDDAAEIMVEYKETLDAAQSIAIVRQRHRRAEEERRCAEARVAAAAPPPARPPEAFTPPPKRVERAQIERLTLTFSVTDTRDRLRLLKQYLIDNHYDFQ